MKPIMLCRSNYLIPFTDFLREIGAPVDRYLGIHKLPALDETDGCHRPYIPLVPSMRFISDMASRQGIPDLGLRAMHTRSFSSVAGETTAALAQLPTLYSCLQALCRHVPQEANCVRYWYTRNEDHLILYSKLTTSSGVPHLENSGWIQNLAGIRIVRDFAGVDWTPSIIAFEAKYTPGAFARSLFPNALYLTGQKASWITIPVSLLSRTRPYNYSDKSNVLLGVPGTIEQLRIPPIAEDFVGSLKMLLPSYMGEQCPSIRMIADIAGCGVRTLQRKLAETNLNFSTLLRDARLEMAFEMLKRSEIKVIDIAFALGYSDPAHFSRAFRNITGNSPREFRQTRILN